MVNQLLRLAFRKELGNPSVGVFDEGMDTLLMLSLKLAVLLDSQLEERIDLLPLLRA